jgi:hypothetical protein
MVSTPYAKKGKDVIQDVVGIYLLASYEEIQSDGFGLPLVGSGAES